MDKEIKNSVGVFAVKCKKSKRCFVGWSMDADGRLRVLKSDLKKGRGNKFILEDYIKFGVNEFEFKVVERCLEKMLLNLVQDYSRKVIENGWSLYNENIIVIYPTQKHDNIPVWIKKEIGEPIQNKIASFDEYMAERRELTVDDERGCSDWTNRVNNDPYLTQKQKKSLNPKYQFQ